MRCAKKKNEWKKGLNGYYKVSRKIYISEALYVCYILGGRSYQCNDLCI